MRLSLLVIAWYAVVWQCLPAVAEEKTYEVGSDGFIRDWVLLEPMPMGEPVAHKDGRMKREMLDRPFLPNWKTFTPKNGDRIQIGDNAIFWHAFHADNIYVDLSQYAERVHKWQEDAVFLAVAYIVCDRDYPNVQLSAAVDNAGVWRLNGKEILRQVTSHDVRRVDHLEERELSEKVTLKEGVNVLLAAIINSDGPAGARVRFVDHNEAPIADLRISLTPPGVTSFQRAPKPLRK